MAGSAQSAKSSKKKNVLIAVGSQEGAVRIYDQEMKQQIELKDFSYGVSCLAVEEENGEFLFSGEKNGVVHIHKFSDEGLVQKNQFDLNSDLHAILFDSHYYKTICCATGKGLIVHEVLKGGKQVYSHTQSGAACLSLALDESKKYLFAGFSDGAIRVYLFNEGEVVAAPSTN